MKSTLLLTALLFVPFISNAQVMDTGDLDKLEKGNYSFVKGKIQVVLDDSTTPDFITRDFTKRGFEISSFDISPVIGYGKGEISDSLINIIKKHPFIKEVTVHQQEFDEKARQKVMDNENMSEERKESLIIQLEAMSENKMMQIFFMYEVTEQMAINFAAEFPLLKLELQTNFPRSVIVKTGEDKEPEIMDVIEQLPYVEYTALIGMIGQE